MNIISQVRVKQALTIFIAQADPPPAGKRVEVVAGLVDTELKTAIFDYAFVDLPKEPSSDSGLSYDEVSHGSGDFNAFNMPTDE